MAHQGNFFVIEGTDGSGKGTQFRLLSEHLQQAGYEVATFDFPRYEEESSYFVREYLNGKYGSADEVGPYTGSLFFSLDRYQAAPAIRQALSEGKIVLANRFTGSNMAHQGTKFANTEQRRGYFIWLDNLEFQMLGIPRPDLNIVLRVPAEIAQSLVDKKEKRSYTDKKRDIHEADLGHLQRSVEVYDDLCNLFPKDFSRIDCVRSDKLLSIDDVQKLLWEKLQPLLPPPSTDKPSLSTTITEAATPQPADTTTKPGQLVLQASARIAGKLAGQLASNSGELPLLTPYDTLRNAHGQFNYYVPDHLDPTTKNTYCETLDQLYETHAELVQTLTSYLADDTDAVEPALRAAQIAQAILPCAAQTNIVWQGSSDTAENTIAGLLQSELHEENILGQSALDQLTESVPDILAKVNACVQENTAVNSSKDLAKLANTLLGNGYAGDISQATTLVEALPRNELDLASDILYAYSDEPLSAIRSQVAALPYEAKLEVLQTYIGGLTDLSSGNEAIQKTRYSFDTLSAADTLYEFMGVLPNARITHQELSPRFGYEVPNIIEEAGLTDQFLDCFDMSLSLHSKLQQAGYSNDAAYAVLLGNRVRWQANCTAHEAKALAKHAAQPVTSEDFRQLALAMQEKIAEKHPIIAELYG